MSLPGDGLPNIWKTERPNAGIFGVFGYAPNNFVILWYGLVQCDKIHPLLLIRDTLVIDTFSAVPYRKHGVYSRILNSRYCYTGY